MYIERHRVVFTKPDDGGCGFAECSFRGRAYGALGDTEDQAFILLEHAIRYNVDGKLPMDAEDT